MNILLVHNNFPGQFRHVAKALLADPRFQVAAIGSATARPMPGVSLHKYSFENSDRAQVHPFARRFDLECRRAEHVLYACTSLARSGFKPHTILAHSGWGESLPLREVFKQARIITYCEFYYRSQGLDVGFDPEFSDFGVDGLVALQLKNAATLISLVESDDGLTPTVWQRSTFPIELQAKLTVLHEGIDTEAVRPSAEARVQLPDGSVLTPASEVVTYVARNLEPLRGYHVFMRALPEILRRRPNARALIVGGHGTSYGAYPTEAKSWQDMYYREVADRIDPGRVHFLGHLPYDRYLQVLQVSSVHVYLTYPFVLSWSLIEALSAGCVVVASDTGPVQEVIDQHNGLLVPFFDHDAIADRVVRVLTKPADFHNLRRNARHSVVKRYSLSDCVQRLVQFVGH